MLPRSPSAAALVLVVERFLPQPAGTRTTWWFMAGPGEPRVQVLMFPECRRTFVASVLRGLGLGSAGLVPLVRNAPGCWRVSTPAWTLSSLVWIQSRDPEVPPPRVPGPPRRFPSGAA